MNTSIVPQKPVRIFLLPHIFGLRPSTPLRALPFAVQPPTETSGAPHVLGLAVSVVEQGDIGVLDPPHFSVHP